jgi:tetratricopeptide (TPR) repeat protein
MSRKPALLLLFLITIPFVEAAVLVPDELEDVGRPEGWYLDFGGMMEGSFQAQDIRGMISAMRLEHQRQDGLAQAERRAAAEPDSLEAQATLADWYFLSGRLDEAAGRYWRAARLDPLNVPVLESFAFSMLALNDHRNGLRVYERLLALESRPRALFNRAAAFAHLGRYDEAIQDWTEYLRRNPAEWRAVYNMGVVHQRAERPAEAARMLQALLPARSGHPYVLAANIRVLQGKPENQREIDRLTDLLSAQIGRANAIQLIRVPDLPIFLIR